MIPESLVSKPMKAVINNPTKPEMIAGYFSVSLLIEAGGCQYRNGITIRAPIKITVSGVLLIRRKFKAIFRVTKSTNTPGPFLWIANNNFPKWLIELP